MLNVTDITNGFLTFEIKHNNDRNIALEMYKQVMSMTSTTETSLAHLLYLCAHPKTHTENTFSNLTYFSLF